MPIRTIITLAVAILLGVGAVFLVRVYLTNQQKAGHTALTQQIAYQPVVVAVRPIERGEAMQAQLLKVVNFPRDAVPTGAFQTVAEVVGPGPNMRLALRSVAANEPVLLSRLSGPGARADLSGTLTAGMRAISVRSNEIAGVAGFVLPGDRIDILLTRTINGGAEQTTVTQILAQNVRVLGVDQISSEDAGKPVVARAVTLEVTPDQAQSISLAQAVGAVTLSLRQAADDGFLSRKATTVADLGVWGRRAAPAPGGGRVKGRGGLEVRVTRGVETAAYTVSK